MMAQKPLMLKDFLEVDDFMCSPLPADATTVRRLLEAELDGRIISSRPKWGLTRLSAVFNAVKNFSASRQSEARVLLPRSFSQRLRRSFWKNEKRGEAEEHERLFRVRDIVRLRSFDGEERTSPYFPSPVVSISSSSSSSSDDEDGESSGSDFLLSSCDSSEFLGVRDSAAAGDGGKQNSPRKSPNRIGHCGGGGESFREATTGRRDSKEEERDQEMESGGCQSEEEKDQLSPVAVMDFPYQDEEDDEEDDTTLPGFEQTLANIERTKHQLLQKIRRFECLAELDLDPLDLDPRFASFEDDTLESSDHVPSDDEKTARALLRQLKARSQWCPQGSDSVEKLLLDFFTEGLSCSGQWSRPETVEEGLLEAAGEWVDGVGCKEDLGVSQVKETERSGGWTCFSEEEGEVAAEVEVGVMGWLLEELVLDLVSC